MRGTRKFREGANVAFSPEFCRVHFGGSPVRGWVTRYVSGDSYPYEVEYVPPGKSPTACAHMWVRAHEIERNE